MRDPAGPTSLLSRRRFLLAVLSIVVGAFALRVGMASAFVGLSSPPDAQANPDQVDFEAIAWQVARGHGFVLDDGSPTARRAVGTVASLLPPYLVAGRSYAAGRVWIALLSAATCGLVVWIGAMGFSRRVGLTAGAMLALYPGHAYYAMHFLSEAPFGFWLALSVALTMRAHRASRVWWYAPAGLAWGMLILTKPQFVLLLPLVCGAFVLYTIAALLRKAGRAENTRQVSRHGVAFQSGAAIFMTTLTAGACMTPWIIRNHAVMGVPGLSTIVGHGLWGGNNELVLDDPVWRGRWLKTSELERRLGVDLPADETAANKAALGYGLRFIRENPREMPGLAAAKLGRLVTPFPRTGNQAVYWSEAVAWCLLAPLCVLGFVRWWRHSRSDVMVMLLPIIVTLAVAVVFFAIVRYRNALSPVLVVIAAPAVESLGRFLADRFGCAGTDQYTAPQRLHGGSVSPREAA